MTKTNSLLANMVMLSIAGCGGCGGERASEPDPVAPIAPSATYDVHEWGLVRGTSDDRMMLSGPHAEPVPMPVAKPVLYFHRVGQGALSLDLHVQVPHGRIVEHWPLDPDAEPASISWRGVTIGEGSCAGTRYASTNELPCSALSPNDACETAELAVVETDDSDCLRTSDGSKWNHLFYRGEVTDPPNLPLRLVRTATGLSVIHVGSEPLVGKVIVLQHSVRPEAALVVDPPAPGQTLALGMPDAALSEAALALSSSLESAGLSDPEAAAFRRAWDLPFFGLSEHAAAGEGPTTTTTAERPAANPVGVPRLSIVYVLPESTANSLATLQFSPAPRTIRRVIVAWADEQPR